MTSIFPVSASVGQVFNSYIFDGTSWNIDNSIFENYLEESNASATYLDKISASTTYATKAYADNSSSVAAAAVVDSAPETLNTLNELSAALNDDANFASTITTALGNKLDISTASSTYLTQANASSTYANMTTTPISGFRNVIINGDFRINQRNGTTQVVDPVSASKYVTDRWACYRASYATGARYQTVSVDMSLLPNISLEAARVGRVNTTTGTGSITFSQPIELDNIGHTVGQVMTLSFYARAGDNFSSASSILNSEIYEDTVQVSPGGATTSPRYTTQGNTLTTSWQRFTHTFTRDATKQYVNAVRFNYLPVGTAGTDDHFEITGVQLELGAIATPFEQRPIGTELALCQRYYWRINAGTAYARYGMGHAYSSVNCVPLIVFPTTMRIPPTSFESNALALYAGGGVVPATYSGSIDSVSTNVATLTIASSGLSAGTVYTLLSNGTTSGFLAANAEL
jgi:hypothetical protein